MNKKLAISTFLFAVLSASLLFAAFFYYRGLSHDGGWYSYPALALSRGGSPTENLQPIDRISSVQGVKAIFRFKTIYSIRIFYTSLWFRYISQNIISLKFLSLLELIAFFILAYLLIHRFCQDKFVALMLFAILINDKRILEAAASNYRPDIILAALCALTFLLLLRQDRPLLLFLGAITSCLMTLTHATSVIPFACIICFFLFHNVLNGNYKLRANYAYLIIGILAVFVFMNRGAFFDTLFPSPVKSLTSPVNMQHRILRTWESGFMFIFTKELYRWGTYFFRSNVAQLLVLFIGILLFFRQSLSSLIRDKTGLSLLLSTFTGLIFFAVLDPHQSTCHSIPMVLFFFLILAHSLRPSRLHAKGLKYMLVGLVCFTSLCSIAVAGKIIVKGHKSGYNIAAVAKSFEDIFYSNHKEYLIVGPTEIWPFIKEDRDVLIIDTTRNQKDLPKIKSIIDSVDYIVINRDYTGYGWEQAFLRYYPGYYFDPVSQVGGQNEFIKISRLKKMK